jgi:hypothetical protein
MLGPDDLIKKLLDELGPHCALRGVGEYQRFYAGGIKQWLNRAGVIVAAESFDRSYSAAVAAAANTAWIRELPSEQWGSFARNQADRACRFQLMTAPRAALAILGVDHIVKTKDKNANIFGDVYIRPALSYVTDFTLEVLREALRVLKKEHGDGHAYLRSHLAQLDETVVYDLARGKTVTKRLAEGVLREVRKVIRDFGGEVSNDQVAREKAIRRLRERERGNSPARERYTKRISSSGAEVFDG